MKYFIPAAAAALLLGLSACSHSSRSDAITNFVIDETIKSAARNYCGHDSATGTDIYMQLTTGVQWLEKIGEHNIKPLQDSIIAKMYGSAMLGKGIDKAILAYLDNADQFQDMGLNFRAVDSIPPALGPGSDWSADVTGNIMELNEQFVSYRIVVQAFTGGAHGSMIVQPFTYALAQGVVLTPQNMFIAGSEKEVLNLVATQLAADLNVSVNRLSDAGLFSDALTIIGSPYIDNYDIVFFYNQYDIAPYSMGTIEVHVPAWTLEKYLTPLARSLTIDDTGE